MIIFIRHDFLLDYFYFAQLFLLDMTILLDTSTFIRHDYFH
jgi:hypothetical protein